MAAKLLFVLAFLTLAGFGVACLLWSSGMMQWIGFEPASGLPLIEFRSFYGGLEIGLALLFILPHGLFGTKEKLIAADLIFGSVGLTRLISLATIGIYSPVFIGIGLFELSLALFAAYLLWQLCRAQQS